MDRIYNIFDQDITLSWSTKYDSHPTNTSQIWRANDTTRATLRRRNDVGCVWSYVLVREDFPRVRALSQVWGWGKVRGKHFWYPPERNVCWDISRYFTFISLLTRVVTVSATIEWTTIGRFFLNSWFRLASLLVNLVYINFVCGKQLIFSQVVQNNYISFINYYLS